MSWILTSLSCLSHVVLWTINIRYYHHYHDCCFLASYPPTRFNNFLTWISTSQVVSSYNQPREIRFYTTLIPCFRPPNRDPYTWNCLDHYFVPRHYRPQAWGLKGTTIWRLYKLARLKSLGLLTELLRNVYKRFILQSLPRLTRLGLNSAVFTDYHLIKNLKMRSDDNPGPSHGLHRVALLTLNSTTSADNHKQAL